MCGRITATFEFSDIRIRWNLERDLPHYTPRFNIAPETRHRTARKRQRMQGHALGVDPVLGQGPDDWKPDDKRPGGNTDRETRVQGSGGKPPLHHPC